MQDSQPKKPGFWQIILSTLAAAFGVQSRKNHEQDVKQGNMYIYITAGIIFTAILIVALITVVRIVLAKSGL